MTTHLLERKDKHKIIQDEQVDIVFATKICMQNLSSKSDTYNLSSDVKLIYKYTQILHVS